MHLAQRAYVLLVLTGVLAVLALWTPSPAALGLWRWPLALLLVGFALESRRVRRAGVRIEVRTAARAFLGRAQPVQFVLVNPSATALTVEFVPLAPAGFDPASEVERVRLPAHTEVVRLRVLRAARLGSERWPELPARVRGHLGLAWWTQPQPAGALVRIAPDAPRARLRTGTGMPSGARTRRSAGAGAELHQLRPYAPGDPPARIDWKATARLGRLVSREWSEEQHLDVLLALDAGAASRVRAGALDRLGLYANVAARLAAAASPEDRIGLIAYAARPLTEIRPVRAPLALTALTRALERLPLDEGSSEPLAAALRIRTLLTRRSLVVFLTDVEDPALSEALAAAVRLLTPRHLVVAAGVDGSELAGCDRQDPWVALALEARASAAARTRARLRTQGAPVLGASRERLAAAVLSQYQALRRARRV